MARIKQIIVKKCPLQRCSLSFINEWNHQWDYHPDSSNYHWAPGLSSSAFLETTNQTMALKENQDPRYWDPQARDPEVTETEADDSKPVVNKKEEPSVSLSEEEPEKGSEKENPVTSSDCDKKDSQVRVPEVTITKAVESGLVVNKKEETPASED